MKPRNVVWLFRSGEDSDPYESALSDAGFDARSVPVLEFEWVNTRELRRALEHPKQYDGLVFTSPRAVEAFADAMPWLPSENVVWHGKSFFAVGPRTADELRRIGFDPEGEEAGSGDLLARYILGKQFEKPLLLLCGDRRRDELPDRLNAEGVALEEVCVYRTVLKDTLDLDSLPSPDWVVFFSPSGIEAVTNADVDLSRPRIAAIGTTTASALEAYGHRVDAIAQEPSPGGVAAAILDVMGR